MNQDRIEYLKRLLDEGLRIISDSSAAPLKLVSINGDMATRCDGSVICLSLYRVNISFPFVHIIPENPIIFKMKRILNDGLQIDDKFWSILAFNTQQKMPVPYDENDGLQWEAVDFDKDQSLLRIYIKNNYEFMTQVKNKLSRINRVEICRSEVIPHPRSARMAYANLAVIESYDCKQAKLVHKNTIESNSMYLLDYEVISDDVIYYDLSIKEHQDAYLADSPGD